MSVSRFAQHVSTIPQLYHLRRESIFIIRGDVVPDCYLRPTHIYQQRSVISVRVLDLRPNEKLVAFDISANVLSVFQFLVVLGSLREYVVA
jgi:hypothetical protein